MQEDSKSPAVISRIISALVLAAFSALLVVSAVLLLLFLMPYPQAASWVNHLARDGQLEAFSALRYQQWRTAGLILSALSLIFSLASLFFWRRSSSRATHWIMSIPVCLHFLGQDWATFWRAVRKFGRSKMIWALLAVTGIAIILRIFLIMAPMQHDEAYSAVIFGFEPLHNSLSDYHYPNNHVFHTLLVHVSYLLFGAQEWAVRLPAFLSGVLLAPLGFVLAKRWYGTKSAWLAGIMIASLPALIDYSTNSRGYTLMALFTLLLFILGTYLKSHQNLAGWLFVILFGALGFYTLPIMVYPLAIFYAWLGLSWLISDYNQDSYKNRFLLALFLSGILTTILGVALYIPIFRNWGIQSLFANPYVEAVAANTFHQTLISRAMDAWQMLNAGKLPWIGFVFLIGFLLSTIFYRRIVKEKLPLQLISLITIVLFIFIQRPNIYARTWIFFLPLLCIWAAAGLIAVFDQIPVLVLRQRKMPIVFILTAVWSIFFAVGGILYNIEKYPDSLPQSGDIEKTTLFLKGKLKQDDIVVITAIDDAPMWFYFVKYGLPKSYFERNRPFETAYVIVNPSDNQTVHAVIADRGPDTGFFDFSTLLHVNTIGKQEIYGITANKNALRNAYGNIDLK